MKFSSLLACILLLAAACADTVSDADTDRLTIGTGLGDGVVTGTADRFLVSPGSEGILLHWAIESRYDIGRGSELALLLEENVDGRWVERELFEYGPVDSIEVYYLIESYYHDRGAGLFRATVISGIRIVASREYMIDQSG